MHTPRTVFRAAATALLLAMPALSPAAVVTQQWGDLLLTYDNARLNLTANITGALSGPSPGALVDLQVTLVSPETVTPAAVVSSLYSLGAALDLASPYNRLEFSNIGLSAVHFSTTALNPSVLGLLTFSNASGTLPDTADYFVDPSSGPAIQNSAATLQPIALNLGEGLNFEFQAGNPDQVFDLNLTGYTLQFNAYALTVAPPTIAVPTPATLPALVLGLGVLALTSRRRGSRQQHHA